MTTSLRLEVLGGLRITLDDAPVTGFVSRKVEALLCYLAVERRSHLRATLATLFWGDVADVDAATNLRQALANLRRLLDPFLIITRHSVELNPDSNVWLDSAVFAASMASVHAIDLHTLRAASELYRGDFLAGFVVRDASGFDEWAITHRERLREHALTALHVLAQHAVAQADYAAGINDTQRLLALDPWREEAHRQLMWLYLRSGQRSAALAQYQTCRQILARELGVEPMIETTALYDRIKAAQSLRTGTVPQAQPLVGRKAEQAELSRLIANPASRLVVITGPGGIGKTRLALQAAAEWATRFLHGSRVASLATANSAERLISAIATTVGCGVRNADDAQEQLLCYLEDKDLLLVLDTFEHLIDAGVELLAQLLQRAPDVKLLVTSRERLQLHDEYMIELRGLDVPPPTMTDGVESYSGVQLFLQQARKMSANFVLAPSDKPAVVRICQLVEGLPLGIELAAAWLRVLSCADIVQEIERNLEFLSTSLRDVPMRHRSLRAVFDHSWQLLSEAERQGLRRLTVFRGGFTRDAAALVVDGSVSLLLALVDQSLLRKNSDSPYAPRYDMHELVWHYAFQKLQQAGELAELRARHLCFCVQLTEAAELELVGEQQKLWLERLECEHDNLRAALQWALEDHQPLEAARLCCALWRFWWMHGHLREGSRWLEQTLAQLPRLDIDELAESMADYPRQTATPCTLTHPPSPVALRAKALHGAGVLWHEQGKYEQARAHYEESLALRRKQGDKRGIAASLNSLGVIALDQGDYARAEILYEESLALKREVGNRAGISVSLHNLALVFSVQGHYERAQSLYQESLAVCRELGDKDGIATSLGNLAAMALQQHNLVDARSLFVESLTLRRDLGDKEGIAECLEGLAGVAGAAGLIQGNMIANGQDVARLYGAAEALREAIGAPMTPIERSRFNTMTSAARTHLGEATFVEAWAEGRVMSLDEAITYGCNTQLVGPE